MADGCEYVETLEGDEALAEVDPFVVDGEQVLMEGEVAAAEEYAVEEAYIDDAAQQSEDIVQDGHETVDMELDEEAAEAVGDVAVDEGAVAEGDEVMDIAEAPAEGVAEDGSIVQAPLAAEFFEAAAEVVAEGEEVLDVAPDDAGMPVGANDEALAMQESVVEEPTPPTAPPPLSMVPTWKGKGKGKGKDFDKGKGKGKDKGFSKGKNKDVGKGFGRDGFGKGKQGLPPELFYGLIYTAGAKTGNMLVRSWKATQQYGSEAMIPAQLNPSGAVVGDKISFEIVPGKDGGRPIAINVTVRGHLDQIVETPTGTKEDIRRQILYYFSDENLKQDKFFQGIINSTPGGWISMATILGCPRMEKMGATPQSVKDAIKDCPELEVREAPEEGIRRTAPPPALDGGDTAGGPPAALAASAAAAGGDCGAASIASADDVFFAGVVKRSRTGWKLFIECDAIKSAYDGKDAWFDPKQKPQGVEEGNLVVFTLAPNNSPSFAPKVRFMARLAGVGPELTGARAPPADGAVAAVGIPTLPSRPPAPPRPAQPAASGIPRPPVAKASPQVAKAAKASPPPLRPPGSPPSARIMKAPPAAKVAKVPLAHGVQKIIQKPKAPPWRE